MRSGEKGYPGMMDRVLENDIERTNFTICFDYPFSFEIMSELLSEKGELYA